MPSPSVMILSPNFACFVVSRPCIHHMCFLIPFLMNKAKNTCNTYNTIVANVSTQDIAMQTLIN